MKNNALSENYKRKEYKKECSRTQSSSYIQALFKKKEPTTGNWTSCFKSVQKRAKQDKKYILCEWRAGRKPDKADDPRADMKWVQTAGFLPFFKNYHLLLIDRTDSKGYIWIRKSCYDLLTTSVRKSRCAPIFQPLITLMARQKQERIRKSTTKKGLSE